MKLRTGAIVTLVWLASTLCWLQPGIVVPDGAGYLTYLPSTYFDRDLLFFNEWQRFGMIRGNSIRFKDITTTDHISNHWTAGCALVWYPAFVLGDVLRAALPALRGFPRDGVTLPYNVPVIATSAVAGLAALLIGVYAGRRRFGESATILAALGVWFGSPLMWYSLRNSTMSHAIGAAACALIVLLALRLRDGITLERMFSVGLAIGLAAAVRPQNAPFLLVPYMVIARGQWRDALRRSPALAAGGLIASLPQLIASLAIYGAPLAFVNVGGAQRGNNWHALERVWLWQTLLSSYHGMFVWTPLLAVAVIGFFFLRRDDRGLGNAAMAMFAIQWLMNSVLDRTFWAGASFGQRRFDNCTIFFLLGLAALFSRLPAWLAIVIEGVTCLWTMSLFFAAGLIDINSYQTIGELWHAQLAAIHVSHFGLFVFSPELARFLILELLIATLLFLAAIAVLATRLRDPRLISGVAAVYFAGVAVFFAVCARNDAGHVAPWRPLIAANRRHEVMSGSIASELSALHNEYVYLKRSGRDADAEATRRDAEALVAGSRDPQRK